MDFEAERLKTAFKVLDLDEDGFITKEELAHALSKTGDQFTDKEISDIISRADKNNDGKIDYNGKISGPLFTNNKAGTGSNNHDILKKNATYNDNHV